MSIDIDGIVAKTTERIDQLEAREICEYLNLYEEKKIWAPVTYTVEQAVNEGYQPEFPEKPLSSAYYKIEKIYPELTAEELEKLKPLARRIRALPAESASKLTDVRPAAPKKDFAPGFMKFCAFFIWLGGLVVSIVISFKPKYGTDWSGELEFRFSYFVFYLSLFMIAGAFYYCLSELFSNIKAIRDRLDRQ